MSIAEIEHKYQEWDKGILRLTLKVGMIRKIKWFWDYVIKKKPLFVEIQFYGRVVKGIDPETYEVYYTSPIGNFMGIMEGFNVSFFNSKQIDAIRIVTDGDE